MPVRTKGLTVTIDGDTTGLTKALQGVNKEIKDTQGQLKDVQNLLKLDPGNTELLAQKQRLLSDAIKETKEKLDTLQTAAKEANDALAKGDITKDQYDALQREIVETTENLKKLEEQAKQSSDAVYQIAAKGEKLKEVGGNVSDVGEKFLPVTAAVTGLGTVAVKTASDFDSSMSQVQATMGLTEGETRKLNTAALEGNATWEKVSQKLEVAADGSVDMKEALSLLARQLGADTKYSAAEAADAINILAMAGYDGTDIFQNLPAVLDLAAAGGLSIADAADYATGILSGFGDAAGGVNHVADLLAKTSTIAKGDVGQFGQALSTVAGMAKVTGQSIDDTTIALGILGNHNISASEAGNALSGVLRNLYQPSDAAAKKMEELGFSAYTASGEAKPLRESLLELRGKLDGLSDKEYSEILSGIFDATTLKTVPFLLDDCTDSWDQLEAGIEASSGSAEQMSATMQDNLSGQIQILSSQLQELSISFGKILMPAVRNIVGKIQEFVDWLNNLDEGTKTTITTVALVVGAVGPVLIIVGKLITAVGTIMSLFPKISAAIATAKTALAGFASGAALPLAPLAAVVAAVGGLVAAFIHLWNNNEEFRAKITEIWGNIKETLGKLFSGIADRLGGLGEAFGTIAEAIKTIWDGLCQILAPLFEGAFQEIAIILESVTDAILGVLDIFIGIFTGDWDTFLKGVDEIFGGVMNLIYGTFENVLDTIRGVLDTFVGFFGTTWEELWTGVSGFFSDIWSGISGFFSDTATAISDGATSIFSGMGETLAGIWEGISSTASDIWQGISDTLSPIVEGIGNAVVNVWQGVKETLGPLLEALQYLFQTIWEAILVIVSRALEGIKNWVESVWNGIVNFLRPVLEAIRGIVSQAWEGIKSVVGGVMSNLKGVVEAGWNAVKSASSTAASVISSVVSQGWNAIKSSVGNVMQTIGNTAVSIWGQVQSGVSQYINNILGVIKSGFEAAANFLTNLAGAAYNWGRDIIAGLINGIKSAIGALTESIRNVADHIRSFLHFSVPDEGPLRDYESWMPDFMKGLASGIEGSRGLIQDAIGNVSADLAISPASDSMAAMQAGPSQSSGVASLLSQYLPYLPQLAQLQVVTDTGAMVGQLAPRMNQQLGKIASRERR